MDTYLIDAFLGSAFTTWTFALSSLLTFLCVSFIIFILYKQNQNTTPTKAKCLAQIMTVNKYVVYWVLRKSKIIILSSPYQAQELTPSALLAL